jgi:hypothetical protein
MPSARKVLLGIGFYVTGISILNFVQQCGNRVTPFYFAKGEGIKKGSRKKDWGKGEARGSWEEKKGFLFDSAFSI